MTAPGKRSYGRYRFAVLGGAFLLILVNPFLNYFLQQNFVQGWYQSLGFGSLWFVSPLEGIESLLITKSLYLPSLIGMMILGAPLFVFFSPPGLVGREIMMAVFFRTVALEGVILLVILLLELLTRRFFCRTFCPLGWTAGLFGYKKETSSSPSQGKLHEL